MRKLLKFFLKILAKRVIARYQPIVIGVTGSVGKTMAKEAIYAVLSRKFWVRKNEENFNNELGVPETVLGIDPNLSTANIKPGNWPKLFRFWNELAKSLWLAYGLFKSKYPKMLVLELAAAKPGDMDYLVDIVRPQVGVVTAVGEVPVHVEFYASPEAVAKEKSQLIAALPVDGLAVLNYDDQTVLDMKEKSKAQVMTFGFSKKADAYISDISYFVSESSLLETGLTQDTAGQGDYKLKTNLIGGLSFKINQGYTFIPAKINNMIASHQLYGPLAAVAVGFHFGINLIDIAGALENIELSHHRMNLLRGVKNSLVIDDTYNASPLSTHAALDTLRDFAKASFALSGHRGRKIAVLGDMKELGKYEIEAHRAIGNLAAERCDILVTVGAAGKFIADSAGKSMPADHIFSFDTSDEAKLKVQEIIKEGDVALVKGSRSMKMEKIVEEIALAS